MGASLGGGTFSDINMTPLIDIVLVVLIIMMVNVPIEVETLGVKVPNPDPPPRPPPTEKPEQLVIMMYEDGKVALNRHLIGDDRLFYEVTRRLKPMRKKIVFIDAYPTLNYGTVVDMIDLAKEAGAEKVAFARLKEEGPLTYTSIDKGAMPRGVYQGSPSVVGFITEKRADTQFKPFLPTIRSCYEQALASSPALTGRMVLRLDIWPEGEVIGQEVVVSTLDSPELDACILEKAPALRFEPLGEGNTASVQVPLLFSPG